MPRQQAPTNVAGGQLARPPSGGPMARRRTTAPRATSGARQASAPRVGGPGGSTAGVLKFYTDDSPGFKVGPQTVLIMSLVFIGLVVALHVAGKFRS
eukprot:CAMPEP_0182452866 /NCGR_PEP_ID=MMETSP1319-20130603/177_1 /TAXON_ID=172717 /ORGANISM="Bolidomonas pacifica, Strain RCC208" /LENGTH=96 /DNA_ID=CAMNT_0024650745 /DNA_START=8 /DNA_END=298 /DNA_ORIENTATION=+